MNIELIIDELILDGVDPADRFDIQAAVEHELTRLIAERGLPAAWRSRVSHHIEVVQGGRMGLATDSEPGAVGAQVASSIYARFQTGLRTK